MRPAVPPSVWVVDDSPLDAERPRRVLAPSYAVQVFNDGSAALERLSAGDVPDVIVLDCAPTAESLRFIAMPTTLEWYMKHVFTVERNVLKAIRPLVNRLSPVELPSDSYFVNVLELFGKIAGIENVLEDPQTTSVRLVTNAERMVMRETQRAFVYFSLHGLTVDNIIVNRVLPPRPMASSKPGAKPKQASSPK